MNLNSDDTMIGAIKQIEGEVEDSVQKSFNSSSLRSGSLKDEDNNYQYEGSFRRAKTKQMRDTLEYVEKIRKSLLIYKFYNSVSIFVSATSSIFSLVCLLMIAFQVQGIINLCYICFCLYFVANAINFVYQKNWNFPTYLKKFLKRAIMFEICLQFAYQLPATQLHEGETNPKGWQQIIGFLSIWRINPDDHFPESINASQLVLKCLMYTFVLLQENVFRSKEYKRFINSTLAQIRTMSERKAEAMAYIYNNFKIKTTIQNQDEKEKMMKKLARVNKQLKKWNQTVFSKSSGASEQTMQKVKDVIKNKAIKPKEEIKEAPQHLEEDKEHSEGHEDQNKAIVQHDASKAKNGESESTKPKVADSEYEDLAKSDLVNKLAENKLGLPWRIYIWGIRNLANQVLFTYNNTKLDYILEDAYNGDTKILTSIEQKLLKDHEADLKTKQKMGYKSLNDIPEEERSGHVAKATKSYKLVIAYLVLVFSVLLSNTSFICYFFMILTHIMNGSLVSLVYPFSIFIYAMLEEKRPNKKYWMLIIYYSSIILVIKFVLQTYPISDWLTPEINPKTGEYISDISANYYLKTYRIGLEVITDGRNFANYFTFEALILLSVTFHMFIQIFAGVWDAREIERETIHQAAARIANVQKKRRLEKEGKTIYELEDAESGILKQLDHGICGPDYERLRRRRCYSVNDCLRLREVMVELEQMSRRSSIVEDKDQEDLIEIEREFAFGGAKFADEDDMAVKDTQLQEMKRQTRKQFLQDVDEDDKEERKFLKQTYHRIFKESGDTEDKRQLPMSNRAMTEYFYIPPNDNEIRQFVIENQVGENKLKMYLLKIKLFFTQNSYFESLFPSVKQQKPGLDLYAPMAAVQVLIIVFMIPFYTTMDPDYTNVTSENLQTTNLNKIMVLFIFAQIAIIVLDRYLYLAREYVVIEREAIQDEDSDEDMEDVSHAESISQFDRSRTYDLRSSSSENLLLKGMGIEKKSKVSDVKHKNVAQNTNKALEDIPDDDEDDTDRLDEQDMTLSKTDFNKTIVLKYYLQCFLLIVVHIIVFWYFPTKANMELQQTAYCDYTDPDTGHACNEVSMNWALIVFYLLYCAYFAVSALQIRFGLPELRKGNFAMSDTGPANKALFQGYLAAPFIVELKIISDWTFTRTALDLFQWIKFENIYGDLFIAKCVNKGYLQHPIGEPMPIWKKASFGCCGLFVLILLIAGPLLFFSGFNPLAKNNFVTGASLKLRIVANLTEPGAVNSYELFNTDRFAGLKKVSNNYWDYISKQREVRNLERELFQQVVLSRVSDTAWSLSPPSQREIYERLANSEDGDPGINIELAYAFDRPEPAGQQRITKELPIINILDPELSYRKQVRSALIKALDPNRPCNPDEDISFYMENWFVPTVRLPQDIKPKLIKAFPLSQNIYVSRNCTNNKQTGQTSFWWEVSQKVYKDDQVYSGKSQGDPEGVVFFTYSEKVTEALISYNLITFYVVVILGIGRAIRAGIQTGTEQIFIKDMPRPDSLLLICEGILISRLENNLEREEELYYVLIDIIRSPEVLKMITESSLKKKEENQ